MLIADTGAIVALYDAADHYHQMMVDLFSSLTAPCRLPVLAVTEVDYYLRLKGKHADQIAFIEDIHQGLFDIENMTDSDWKRSRDILLRYKDLDLGIVDAAVVACAERLSIQRIATVDQRDFRVIRSANGKPFTLVPWDD